MYKKILAVVLLLYAIFGTGWLDLLDNLPLPSPTPPPAAILTIDLPSQEVKERVAIFSEMVTDPSDRAKLAIFNYEFANRILDYSATVQNVNDVYTLAGKTFFEESLINKYDGLSEEIVSLLSDCMSDEEHSVTAEEKVKIHEYFLGVAWSLIQKG